MQYLYKRTLSKKALLFLFALLIPFNFYSSLNVHAQEAPKNIEIIEKRDKWRLTADSVTTLDDGAILEARGNVVIQRGNDVLKAEYARYYTETEWVFARENVFVKLGVDELTASEAEFDLKSYTGFLKDGHIFMGGPHIYFTGEHVNRQLGDTYAFKNATITSCDPADEAWKLKATEATIEIDGYATLSHTQLNVGGIDSPPIPWAILPAKVTRQSGLLKPDFGVSSLHGIFYSQPYFWAINESQDMTFTAGYFEHSGVMLSAEHRANINSDQKSWFAFDYLFSKSPSNLDEPDDIKGFEDNRYWFRGMANGKIFGTNWRYKVNLDYVSDDSFLLDYKSTLTGYDNTKDETFDFFGRDLAPLANDRISEFYLFNKWDVFELAASARYAQNPKYGQNALPLSTDTTVQTLPAIDAFLYPINIFNTPLQIEASAQASYHYRELGTSGMRTILEPKLSLPLNLGFMSLLAQGSVNYKNYFGTKNTYFDTSGHQTSNHVANVDSTVVTAELQALMTLSRIWEFEESAEHINESNQVQAKNLVEIIEESETSKEEKDSSLNLNQPEVTSSRIVALRHTLMPRLSYSFVQDINQDDLPIYTVDDRIYPTNKIELSLRNIFTTKTLINKQIFNEDTQDYDSSSSYSYNNIATFTLSAAYNYQEEQRTKYTDKYENRPFEDIALRANFNAFGLYFNTLASYSPYDNEFTRLDLGMNVPLFGLSKYLAWNTSLSHRTENYDYQEFVSSPIGDTIYPSDDVSLWRNTLTITPTSNFNIHLIHDYDIEDNDMYSFELAASYQHQCYIFTLGYTYNENEQTYTFNLLLPGIFD